MPFGVIPMRNLPVVLFLYSENIALWASRLEGSCEEQENGKGDRTVNHHHCNHHAHVNVPPGRDTLCSRGSRGCPRA